MEECEGIYEEKYGFVALIDVLGVSTISSVEQSKDFLRKWDNVFNSANSVEIGSYDKVTKE